MSGEDQNNLYLELTPNQAAAIFLSLKERQHMGVETGMLYQQIEQYLYARIGLEELTILEELYHKGEL